MQNHYFHLFANGDDAKNFIIGEEEFRAAFNRVAVCSHLCNASVLAFSIEDSHPHLLLCGGIEEVRKFKNKYEDLSVRYIARHRGSIEGINLHCEIFEVNDESYLMNVASYVIVQATKDGKAILPYDYLYGTGSLYFRKEGSILPWEHDFNGQLFEKKMLGSFTLKKQWQICNTKNHMPADWIIVNGFIHPCNFVDIAGYERIFKTHNCFRAFLASGKARDEIIRKTMASVRGVTIEDIEARSICRARCDFLFKQPSTKFLTTSQRLTLAQDLRKMCLMSFRQLSLLTKLPENELRKYIR